MNKFLKIFLVFIGIWAMASLFNGALSGIWLGVINYSSLDRAAEAIAFATLCSFIFSVPLVGLTWLVTCVAQSFNKNGFELFQIVLITAIISSSLGALVFTNTLGQEFRECNYILGFCIVISAVLSVFLFRKKIKNNG